MDSCYFCGKSAIGVEHVPPRCFFPAVKDLPPGSPDFRKNLITVPSCDEHNQALSLDDEYSFYIALSHFENNKWAAELFNTKGMRGLVKKPALVKMVYQTPRRVSLNGSPSMTFQVDRKRFNDVMEKVARGLFFHEMKKPWGKKVYTATAAFREADLQVPEVVQPLAYMSWLLKSAKVQSKGTNPEVFYYEFLAREQAGMSMEVIRMVFYEGLEVFAMPEPQDA